MKRFIIPLFALLLTGCDKTASSLAADKPETAMAVISTPPALESEKSNGGNYEKKIGQEYQTNDDNGTERSDSRTTKTKEITEKIPTQIIKNADIQFQVKDVEASHLKIAALLKQYNSYFGSDSKAMSIYQIENSMVIRIPANDFDKLMDELMKESVYTNRKNITAEDVTAEFVDVQARLRTKKEVEARYLALLKQANKVSDILEIEDKMRVIREEIEAAEGRLKLLKDQVGYSTITLNTYQKLDYTPEPEIGFFSNLTEAFVRGWRNLIEFFIGLVRVWPFVIVFGTALLLAIRKIRSRKK